MRDKSEYPCGFERISTESRLGRETVKSPTIGHPRHHFAPISMRVVARKRRVSRDPVTRVAAHGERSRIRTRKTSRLNKKGDREGPNVSRLTLTHDRPVIRDEPA